MGSSPSSRSPAYLKALLPIVLLVAASIPLDPFSPVGTAEAQATARWWGAGDPSAPEKGWHMRVALKVTNPDARLRLTNPTVRAELDFTELLASAGWPTLGSGAGARLSGFTLDPDSFRLVEYTSRWLDIRSDKPVPARFDPGFYERESVDPYDPTTNPHGTLSWVIPGNLEPLAERYYFLYFDALQYGKKSPAPVEPADVAQAALVSARNWGGAATQFYGHELGATAGAGRWDLIGIYDDTTVTIYDLSSGTPQVHPQTGTYLNPMKLNASEVKQYAFTANAPFHIRADKPILVASRGELQRGGSGLVQQATYGATGFVPSLDKGFAGREFRVPAYAPQLILLSAGGTDSQVTVTSPTGLAQTYTVPADGYVTHALTVPPSGNPPVHTIAVTGGADILVQYGGSGGGSVQIPAQEGTPSGALVPAAIPASSTLTVFADAPAKVRVLDLATGEQVLPRAGPIAGTEPQDVAPGLDKPWVVQGRTFSNPVLLWSRAEGGVTSPGNLTAFAGSGPVTSPYGAPDARTYTAIDRFQVAAYYNGTDVTVTKLKGTRWENQSLSLEAGRTATDQTLFGTADADATYLIRASKPVSVAPIARDQRVYGRFLTGLPTPLAAEAPYAEYRGPLVSLRPADSDAETLVQDTGANQPVTYRALVQNRGRWSLGQPLRDTLTLEAQVEARDPSQWEATLSPTTVTLNTLDTSSITLTVTPKEGVRTGESAKVTVVARSKAIPTVEARLLTVTLMQNVYGVALSFAGGGCPLGGKRCEQGVDNRETFRYPLRIQNLGSVPDTFDLRRSDPGEGWNTEIRKDGQPVTEITLKPKEATTLDLVGVSPDAGALRTASDVEVLAESRGDRSKADKVFTSTRVNPKVNVSLTADEVLQIVPPGGTATFNVSLTNRGNDIFSYRFGIEGVLPDGWSASLADARGDEVTEISLSPDQTFPFVLSLTAAPDAKAHDLYTQKVGIEVYSSAATSVVATSQLILTAEVDQVHNLTVETAERVEMRPGEDATLTLLVRNNGNGDEILTVAAASIPVGWVGPRATGRVYLPPGGEATIPVRFTIPDATENGTYPVGLRLVSDDYAEQNLTRIVTLLGQPALDITGPSALTTPANAERSLGFIVRNTGNVRLKAVLRADAPTSPEGWVASVEPAEVELAPLATASATLRFTAPIGTSADDYTVALRADAVLPTATAASARQLVLVTVERPDVAVVEAFLQEGQGVTAGLTLVTATLRNDGDVEARDVAVGLFLGDRRVDNVTIAVLSPGQSAVATLKVPAGESADQYRVVADPDGAIDEASEDNNGFTLAGASTPGPGALLAALALLGAALLARRARQEGGR